MNKPFIKIGPNAWLNLDNVTDILHVRDHEYRLILKFYQSMRDGGDEQCYATSHPDYTKDVAASLGLELDAIPEPAPVEVVADDDIPW